MVIEFPLAFGDLVNGGILYALNVVDKQAGILPYKFKYDGRYQTPYILVQDIKLINVQNDDSIMVSCLVDHSEKMFFSQNYVLGRSYHDIFEKIREMIRFLPNDNPQKTILFDYMNQINSIYPEYVL